MRENNGCKSILTQLLGHPKEEFVKNQWELKFLKNIIANKDMFKELKKDKPVSYENVQIETATGQKINVDFTLNMYIVDNHEVMQCFIRNFTIVDSK
jgi:hypothetical protein